MSVRRRSRHAIGHIRQHPFPKLVISILGIVLFAHFRMIEPERQRRCIGIVDFNIAVLRANLPRTTSECPVLIARDDVNACICAQLQIKQRSIQRHRAKDLLRQKLDFSGTDTRCVISNRKCKYGGAARNKHLLHRRQRLWRSGQHSRGINPSLGNPSAVDFGRSGSRQVGFLLQIHRIGPRHRLLVRTHEGNRHVH